MRYVVAVNRKEAEGLVDIIGHDTREQAEQHLKEVQAPPTDSFFAAMYRVWEIDAIAKLPESPKE